MNKKIICRAFMAVIAAAAVLAGAVLPSFSGKASGAYINEITTMKIGLYYGSNTLSSANLQNHTGSGYYFGYLDSKRNFIRVGETDEEKITMLKDWNMYLAGSTYYDSAPSVEYSVIGCYHIRLNTVFDSFEAAAKTAKEYSDSFPAYHNGSWYVCVGSYTSLTSAQEAVQNLGLDGKAMTASSGCITVAATGTTRILFQFDCGSDASLTVKPRTTQEAEAAKNRIDEEKSEEVTQDETDETAETEAEAEAQTTEEEIITEEIPEEEKTQTWFKGYRYYGAFQYTRLSGGDITVVNIIDIEDYVKGVVPYEMNTQWPLEALKAQAICARTYAAAHINGHRSYGCDLCNSTCCQAYYGTNRAGEGSNRAVEETKGQYISYNGELCQVFYFSSDGGATENSENVFSEALPYLRGVYDPYEQYVQTGRAHWEYTYTASEITSILRSKGYNCADIVSVTPTYTEMGNIYSLKFTDSNGKNWTFSKYNASSILYSQTYGKYTYSMRFTVSALNDETEGTVLYVNGSELLESNDGLYAVGSGGVIETIDLSESFSVITANGIEEITPKTASQAISADKYIVTGSGWGHNIGMSQYGAKAMAEQGMSCREILEFYFTGVTIG